jgi:DNA-binding MarR family transcriptional regulator
MGRCERVKQSVPVNVGIAGPDQVGSVARIERELTVLMRRAEAAIATKPATERLVRSAYLLLNALETAGPLGIAAMANVTYVDVSTTSRQIVPLEQQGLVRRLSNPADGRGSLIEITPLGLDRLRSAREERYGVFVELLRDWPEGDREVFADHLARLNEAVLERAVARVGHH